MLTADWHQTEDNRRTKFIVGRDIASNSGRRNRPRSGGLSADQAGVKTDSKDNCGWIGGKARWFGTRGKA